MSKSLLHLLCLVSILYCVAAFRCRPDQTETLKRFKNEFEFSSICSDDTNFFRGVICDDKTGAVTSLELPGGCIRGTLKQNSSLFELSHLRYLNLSFNNFNSSPLSSAFGQLKNLEVLYLFSDGFVGQVPSSISNLTRLSALDLSFNQFSGTIPSSLLTMPSLSYLDLSDNLLTGSFEITNSSSNLETLQLGNNDFEVEIIDQILKLVNLRSLILSSINISHPVDLKLFSALQTLSWLDLSGNSLTPRRVNSDIGFPSNMEILILSGCNISVFPRFLKPLKNLWFLSLSDNRIQGNVPDWLWSLPLLTSLELSNNSFTGFKGSLGHVLADSSVKTLSIDLNSFKGSFPNPPVSIINLSAWNNSFTGKIPLSVCNRTALNILDLSYNNFTGSIPPCMGNFTTVNLRKNKLEGHIPDEFYGGALTQMLDVGYNRLTGKLPRSLLNCSRLSFLSVDHNRINDSFPFWLKALTELKVLTLRSNRFDGPISPPDDQGPLAFPKLQILEIAHNRFTGSLPTNYFVNWSAKSLKVNEEGLYMGDYSSNVVSYEDTFDLQYKGLYMEQGKLLTFYVAIDFSGNKLEGEIPKSIGLLKTLIALNLSNNSFTGHIPMSFANVTELESLDLSRNKLSGEIPEELGRLSFLAYIDVSDNQLTGRIPQGTQIIGQPKSSFEGNPGLCGLPLEESCLSEDAPTTQEPEEEEEEEGILKWKAAAMGYGSGVFFGLAVGHVVALYNRGGFIKIYGQDRRRGIIHL